MSERTNIGWCDHTFNPQRNGQSGAIHTMNSTDTQQAETSALVVHAERELDLMGDDSEAGQWMREAVMSLIRVFANGGHSGFSAPYCIETFKRLAQYEPLTPLTGDDDEWIEVADGLWQNKRCSRVFKNAKGEAWDIDGKVFREPDGYSYTNGESRTPVAFPYVPKTVYVDVDVREESTR